MLSVFWFDYPYSIIPWHLVNIFTFFVFKFYKLIWWEWKGVESILTCFFRLCSWTDSHHMVLCLFFYCDRYFEYMTIIVLFCKWYDCLNYLSLFVSSYEYDINDLYKEAQRRWLKPVEALYILENDDKYQFTQEPL